MAQEAPPQGYKAWFEKQAQLQEDGTYLVRPWGYWSGVYQIDETTKRRWVSFRMAGLWLGGIVGLLIVVLKGDAAWGSPRVILSGAAAVLALLTVAYGGLFAIFRRAQRVPKERWKGPAVVDRWGVVSRRKWLRSAITLGVVTVFWAWWSLFAGPPGSFWQSVPFLLFFAAASLLSLFGYWRARQRPRDSAATPPE